jgi:hypothetical protein
MEKINLVVISGGHTTGGVGDETIKDLRIFKVSNFSPSSPDFLKEVKSLTSSFASKFFGMNLDEKFENAETLLELEKIAQKDLYSESSYGWKQTYSISVIEIRNEIILQGLKYLSGSFFIDDYAIEKKIKELKEDKKFEEALELTESLAKLKESIKGNPKSVAQTELEIITKLISRFHPDRLPDCLKKEYQEILEKYPVA